MKSFRQALERRCPACANHDGLPADAQVGRLRSAALVFGILLWSLGVLSASTSMAAGIPDRPEKLQFPPLKYEVPDADEFRVKLKSGPVAYVVSDRELPLVNISILIRTGDFVVPAGKEGLADLTGYLLTKGGIKSRTAEELDERLAFLAAQLSSSAGDTSGGVGLNLLSKDLDEGLALLREALTEPQFQADKLALRKQQTLQSMAQRNDSSEGIEFRERRVVAYGDKFWVNQIPTKASIESITREDLIAFHRDWFHPANMIVAVNGDFDRAEMIQKLEALFANWPFKGRTPPPIPGKFEMAAPGAYLVDKEVNQGRVSLLLPGLTRDHPDYVPLIVMNNILGGGGFTSRLVNRVRSDEGLAYSAYSVVQSGVYYDQPILAGFQTKSRTVAYATHIVIDEMRKIAAERVTDEELTTAKNSFIETLPRYFATKAQVAGQFAQDEFTGRREKDPKFWLEFRARIDAVTHADVQRVAKKYLQLDQLVILVVGDKKEIALGHPTNPIKLEEVARGKVTDVPLKDPMTLAPLPMK